MATKVMFSGKDIVKSLDKFVERIGAVNIDAAVTEALDALADWALAEMQYIVRNHNNTGNAFRALRRTAVQGAGNSRWVEVGALKIRAEDKDGFHVIYLECGSPTLAADPWLRPTMERRAEINTIIRRVFRKWGVIGGG
ncbi:MAG: hypothetical protein FWE69_03830 [Clostridiales bacterium]|nr:hypothetical protein [Clostridiales bacterium]